MNSLAKTYNTQNFTVLSISFEKANAKIRGKFAFFDEHVKQFVKEIHEKLMKGAPGVHVTPGEFRKSQNWIGSAGCTLANATHVPPPPDELMNCLGEWEKFLHNETLPPLIIAAMAHYQFEAIHPFLDGNGRVGRILIILFLMERKILPGPFLYLSAFFEATRQDYYAGLNGVGARGEWNSWLQYFLNGVARQVEDALGRAGKINKQLQRWKAVARAPSLVAAVERLAQNPYLTVNSLAEQMKVAFSTSQRLMDKLQKMNIVTQVDDRRRNRVYCAVTILEILEAPANLTPK